MVFFSFGKSYTKNDLDREIAKLRSLYVQAMDSRSSQLKGELSSQLQEVLKICNRGGFSGMETVEWPAPGHYTSLRNVTPAVQVMIEMM